MVSLNTKVSYRYTDASNYHAYNEAVLCGVLTPEQKQVILSCLYEGEFFVPGAVGLDVELPWEFDPQDDHPYWVLDEDSFEETSEKATVDITSEEFVKSFVENKGQWERLGVEYMLDYGSESEYEDVAEIINDATERCGEQTGHAISDKDMDLT